MSEAQASNVLTSENAADFYAQKLGLASEAPTEAEVVADEAPSEPEQEANTQNESEAENEEKVTEERKPNPKLEKRFSELTKARKNAEESAAREREQRQALENRVRELEQGSNPKPVDDLGQEPQPSQFTDAFEYAKALAEFSAEKALRDRDIQEANRRAAEEQAKITREWADRVSKAKSQMPDFDDIVASSTVQVSDAIRDAILDSDVGPQILYQIASDDEYAEKLVNMPVIKALREIGKLEAKLERKEAKEEPKREPVAKSNAPAPIKPLRAASNAVDVSIDSDGQFHGTYQQWKAARQAKKIR